MDDVTTVNLIGPGKVGQSLLRLLAGASGNHVLDICGRNRENTEQARAFAGAGRAVAGLGEMRAADIWLITVPDRQIAGVAETLAVLGHPPAIAVHCSGFHPSTELAALAEVGWQVASAHPVLSFADPASAVAQFPGCYCGIEGGAAGQAGQLFSALGAKLFAIRTEAKALYHAAAVISNNFTTVLQALAREAWAEAGVPEAVVGDLHAALLRGTVENVLAVGPQAAMTGPAARGDLDVIAAQGAALGAWHPEAGEVYRLLSAMAGRLKSTGKT